MFIAGECRTISRNLWEYAAGKLTDSERQRIEAHLRTCSRCTAQVESLSDSARGIAALATAGVPESTSTWHALRTQLESENLIRRAPARRRFALRHAWAAPLAMGVAAAFLYIRYQDSHVPTSGYRPGVNISVNHGAADAQVASNDTNDHQGSNSGGGPDAPQVGVPGTPILHEAGLHERNVSPRQHRHRPHDFTDNASPNQMQHQAQQAVERREVPLNIDGERPAASMVKRDYVLPPAGYSPDRRNATQFVMGSIGGSQPRVIQASSTGPAEDRIW